MWADGHISEFLDLMVDEVVVEKLLSRDVFGKPTYGDPTPYPARCVGKMRLVRTIAGDQKVSTVTSYIGAVPGITPEDRITLPSRFVPQQPPIIAVGNSPDEQGPHHEVVYT